MKWWAILLIVLGSWGMIAAIVALAIGRITKKMNENFERLERGYPVDKS